MPSFLSASEYNPYYGTYIDLVENEDILEGLATGLVRTVEFFDSLPANKLEYRYAEGKWTPKDILLHLIDTEKIETAFIVPALIQFLLNHPDAKTTDFSSLRQIVYGASPISEDTLLKAIEVMGCEFWQVYGLTETSGIGTTLPPEAHDPALGKLRSCGSKYTGVEIKVVDDTNNELPTGEVGEINSTAFGVD